MLPSEFVSFMPWRCWRLALRSSLPRMLFFSVFISHFSLVQVLRLRAVSGAADEDDAHQVVDGTRIEGDTAQLAARSAVRHDVDRGRVRLFDERAGVDGRTGDEPEDRSGEAAGDLDLTGRADRGAL